jgi:hypothetical protein
VFVGLFANFDMGGPKYSSWLFVRWDAYIGDVVKIKNKYICYSIGICDSKCSESYNIVGFQLYF